MNARDELRTHANRLLEIADDRGLLIVAVCALDSDRSIGAVQIGNLSESDALEVLASLLRDEGYEVRKP